MLTFYGFGVTRFELLVEGKREYLFTYGITGKPALHIGRGEMDAGINAGNAALCRHLVEVGEGSRGKSKT